MTDTAMKSSTLQNIIYLVCIYLCISIPHVYFVCISHCVWLHTSVVTCVLVPFLFM